VSDYTRLTIQGTRNRAELVLPSEEPLAAMVPDILTLLDEPVAQLRPLALVSVLGEQLNTSLSLAEQGVLQGSIVRLVHVDEAPPPPEVADITQLAGGTVDARADRWRPEWAVLAAAVMTLMIGRLVGQQLLALRADRLWVLGAAVALAATAAALARRGGHGAGWTITALAIGLLGAPVESFVRGQLAGTATGAWLGACAALVAAVALVGYRDRGIALGGASAAALVALWTALRLGGMAPVDATGIVGLAGAIGLGLLPGVAMTASGLTRLDDRVIEGGTISRPDALEALAATHRGLNWACVAFGAGTGAAGFVLASSRNGWAIGLAAAIGIVATLQTRVLPLAPQRLALFGAATATVAGLAVSGFVLAPAVTLGGLIVLAAVVIAAVGVRLSGNVRARLARLGNVAELVAVLASVPLLLGLLGVFDDLLGAF
jgi:type VII secretion integral membrane protein EccD